MILAPSEKFMFQTPASRIDAKLAAVFNALGLPAHLARAQASDRPELGDLQCNGALAAAREARRPPRQIAEEIVDRLRGDAAFEAVTVAGPGFVNLRLSTAF